MTNKEELILNKYFAIYGEDGDYELETWTNFGVNMFININDDSKKSVTEQFRDYIDSFDIDYEIETHREDTDYRDNFTITDSVEDFKQYLDWLKMVLIELENTESDIKTLCKTYEMWVLKQLYINDFNINHNTIELMSFVDYDKLENFLIEKFENNYNFEELKQKLNDIRGHE